MGREGGLSPQLFAERREGHFFTSQHPNRYFLKGSTVELVDSQSERNLLPFPVSCAQCRASQAVTAAPKVTTSGWEFPQFGFRTQNFLRDLAPTVKPLDCAAKVVFTFLEVQELGE